MTTSTSSTSNTHGYLRVAQPNTKPQRFMIVKDDRIIAEGLTRAKAQHFIACLIYGDQHPTEILTLRTKLQSQGI